MRLRAHQDFDTIRTNPYCTNMHSTLIREIINPQLERPISYPAYRYFVRQDPELLELWRDKRQQVNA
jgi:hypothetical protein